MKKLFIISTLFLSFLSYSQTKQETIDWLNMQFREHTDSFMGEYKIEIINGETLLISARVENAYMSKWYQYYSFKPKDIESVNTTSAFRTDGKLGLLIKANGSNIYYNNKEFVDEIKIDCIASPDESIIRMKKGLIHLLNLMGNPLKAPKELFKD
jgi:hypothetical protein